MGDINEQELSALEKNAADEAFELLSGLDVDKANRVLAYVQGRLNKPKVVVRVEDRPMFSRGISNPFGKLICVAKTKIDETTFELFLRYCASHGTDVATMLRDCVYLLVYRKTCQQIISEMGHGVQRTEYMTKLIGPFGGPESDERA